MPRRSIARLARARAIAWRQRPAHSGVCGRLRGEGRACCSSKRSRGLQVPRTNTTTNTPACTLYKLTRTDVGCEQGRRGEFARRIRECILSSYRGLTLGNWVTRRVTRSWSCLMSVRAPRRASPPKRVAVVACGTLGVGGGSGPTGVLVRPPPG